MPRSRSYSRSPSKNSRKSDNRSKKKSSHKSRSHSNDRSRSHSRSKKSLSSSSRRYKSRERSYRRSPSHSRSSSRYASSLKHKSYTRKERSKSIERKRENRSKSRSRSSSSSSSIPSGNSGISSKNSSSPKSLMKIKESDLKNESGQQPDRIFTSIDILDDAHLKTNILDDINAESFVPKTFSSTKKISDNIVIDLTSQTISIPKIELPKVNDTIFHPNLYGDDAARMERWVKKLFLYRQKMFMGEA